MAARTASMSILPLKKALKRAMWATTQLRSPATVTENILFSLNANLTLTALFHSSNARQFPFWHRKRQNNSYLSLMNNSSSRLDSNSSKFCGKLRLLQRLAWPAWSATSLPCSLQILNSAKNSINRLPALFRKLLRMPRWWSTWCRILSRTRSLETPTLWFRLPCCHQSPHHQWEDRGNWQSSETIQKLRIPWMGQDRRNMVAMKVVLWKVFPKFWKPNSSNRHMTRWKSCRYM